MASAARRNSAIARTCGLRLSQLPERYEAVLRAKYLDGQSVAAVAEAWNETPKAVESLLTPRPSGFP